MTNRVATNFKAEAAVFAARGWATHPLVRDDNGFPKKAITAGWEKLTPGDSLMLDWASAAGIGVIGGANSGNVGFIDIDDQELAREVAAYNVAHHKFGLMAWTARGRLHVYVQEPTPSTTRKLQLTFRDRPVLVELRASGAYVAASPTPGYTWLNEEWPPFEGTLTGIFFELSKILGLKGPPMSGTGGSGYPKAWQPMVEVGSRNDSLFVESCRLAGAGMPIDEAMAILDVRLGRSYAEGDMSQREVHRTIASAFRHVSRQRAGALTNDAIPIRSLPI